MFGYEDIVHAKVFDILETVGIKVYHKPTLKRLKEAGAFVDLVSGVVKFERRLVELALAKAPRDVKLYDWDENLITEGSSKFMSSGTGVAVLDNKTSRRRPSKRLDVRQMVAIQETLNNLTIAGPLVCASEYERYRVIVETFETFLHTKKHVGMDVGEPEELEAMLELGKIIKGDLNNLLEKPPFHVTACPKSPLSFSSGNICALLQAAEYGLPVNVLSMSMGGATAPVTIMGQLIITMAEIIGGTVMVQLLWPGTAVIAGSVSSVLDMKTGVLCLGAPERPVLNKGVAVMSRYFGLLSIVGGLSADGKDLDVQVGFEKALTAQPLIGYADYIFGLGNLDSAGTYSAAQLLIDNEFAGALLAAAESLDLANVDQEVALIKELSFKGEYLTDEYTYKHFRNYWAPIYLERKNYDQYLAESGPVKEKILDTINELLSKPLEPVVDSRNIEKAVDVVKNLVGPDFEYSLPAG